MLPSLLLALALSTPHRTLKDSPLCPPGVQLLSLSGVASYDSEYLCVSTRYTASDVKAPRNACYRMDANPEYFTRHIASWSYEVPVGCISRPSPLWHGVEACIGSCKGALDVAWEAPVECSPELYPWSGGCPCPGFRSMLDVCPSEIP